MCEMSAQKTITLVCDAYNSNKCELQFTSYDLSLGSPSEVRERAEKEGWKYDKEHKKDVCKECS